MVCAVVLFAYSFSSSNFQVVIGDSRDLLVREPFVAFFKAKTADAIAIATNGGRNGHSTHQTPNNGDGFDFVIATLHVVFGKDKDERVKETAVLCRMLENIQRNFFKFCI